MNTSDIVYKILKSGLSNDYIWAVIINLASWN